ncbi:tRNA threonylcarbamoyladenosine biosynthesis protein TsaE [Stieleria bergensis]|uniref:tRNA threonylcarbamoyladenosine biosynthesis protein TsaE n=1 Tax=Stieleria bergensis TaxID=2528025 RepID=A0A517T312_9BACT|nr:tRNA threonylcarbamoyladenosine biosynthesis protein TsaE [Planctomycetes bacterium SV_7m_r]
MNELTIDAVDLPRLTGLAEALVQTMPRQLVIGMVGTLGAGKTTMTQQIAAALGLDPAEVTSPTFNLLSSYRGAQRGQSIELHHLDAYRLADEDEFLELGVEELFEAENSWVIIEWADRVAAVMPPATLWIELDLHSGAMGDGSTEPDAPARLVTMRTDDFDLGQALDELQA